jgi:LacI family repressor for deo operon, udp, cdd, tsx, nupC, and nupG
MTTRATRARIEDVAAAAGVSVATVSRAVRGLPNVAASTRERVNLVATELGYRPDPVASRLAAGRARTVIVLVPHLSSWYFSNVVAGAEAVCAEAGYDFLILGVGSLDECHRLLNEGHHLERRADGIILVNLPATDAQVRSLGERGVCISSVGYVVDDCPSVRVDDHAVGLLAATHLVELGHRRIGLISGTSEDPMNVEVPRLRHDGFVQGLAAHGITLDPDLVASGSFGIDGGSEAMTALLAVPEAPTAVFAMSDEMAFGALMVLGERGARVGEGISLIGVDDHEFAKVVGLTTIRQKVAEQGAAAARGLLELLERPQGDVHVNIHDAPVELVVRTSTARHRERTSR